jgi:uncharacterized protein (TIGR00369 family)
MPSDVPAGFAVPEAVSGFDGLIGPMYEKGSGDDLVCALRVGAQHLNRRGVVHGGLLFTIADHTLGKMVWHRVGEKPCATVSLNVDYVAGVKPGDWVECSGQVTRETRSLVFIKGELRVDGKVVMAATGVWKKLGAD